MVTTLGDFLDRVQGLSRDTPLVVPASDHSYRDVSVEVGSALIHEDSGWSEDHGELFTPEAEFGKRTGVVIFR